MSKRNSNIIYPLIPSVLGASGVILAAMGAHYLKSILTPSRLDSFQSAVQMHLLHAVLLFIIAMQIREGRPYKLTFFLIFTGVIFFSFSIYGLISGMIYLGPVTPMGGLLLIFGWLSLIYSAIKDKR